MRPRSSFLRPRSTAQQLPWKEAPPIADLQWCRCWRRRPRSRSPHGTRPSRGRGGGAADGWLITTGTRLPVSGPAPIWRRRVPRFLAGDPPTAVAAAGARWRRGSTGRSYDAATARVVLGHACVLAGRREAATLEWESARAAFAAYGAPRRQADVEALLGRALPAAAASAAALARDPSGWRIGFAGREVVMVDLKGIRLLGRLLSSPGKEHHVLDLAGAGTVEPGMPARRRRGEGRLPAAARRGRGRHIAERERPPRPRRAALARRDREYLMAELRRAVGPSTDGRAGPAEPSSGPARA